uniref:Radical SAM protein n=1 Tax=Ignisphaera aggregans TaxID=334771 RepID=A0A7C4BE99_9CREN
MGSARSVIGNDYVGYWYGELAEGCKLCMRGVKTVIFITGICGLDCYYCPISRERRFIGALYADEERVSGLREILDEVVLVRAEGASITGGEPFQRYDLVVKVIRLLKEVFGVAFHIHLYTSGLGASREAVRYLDRIGLDEIRFHIVNDSLWRLVDFAAKETSMDVGIEVPAIPGEEERLWSIITKASEVGVKFVNINELEVSETNVRSILFRGFKIDGSGKAVIGSAEVAKKALQKAVERGLSIAVHFCPAFYKDFIQQRARMIRKARTCAGEGDSVTEEGCLVREGREVEPRLELCAPLFR